MQDFHYPRQLALRGSRQRGWIGFQFPQRKLR